MLLKSCLSSSYGRPGSPSHINIETYIVECYPRRDREPSLVTQRGEHFGATLAACDYNGSHGGVGVASIIARSQSYSGFMEPSVA